MSSGVEVHPASGVRQVEELPAGQRLAPQQLVVSAERGAVRVGVLAISVRPDVEPGVDRHSHHAALLALRPASWCVMVSQGPQRRRELECPRRRPSTVGRDEMIGATYLSRRDDQCIWKPQRTMPSPYARRGGCDVDIERNDGDREPLAEIVDKVDGVIATSGRSDKALGQCRGCHLEPVCSIDGVGDGGARGSVVHVLSVEEPDEDPGVEVDQRHSSRRSSSSRGSYTPLRAPANSSRTSASRSRTTLPGPSACATSLSPTSRPAARSASAGIVIWCFALMRDVPRRRFFTFATVVKVQRWPRGSNRSALVVKRGLPNDV